MSLSPRDLPKKRKNNIRAKILRMKLIENGKISMMLKESMEKTMDSHLRIVRTV